VSGETVVSRWIEAFNAQDLDAMLSCLSEDVSFQPLELLGVHTSYSGHLGVRVWFREFERFAEDHKLQVTGVALAPDGQVVATGSLTLGDSVAIADFCGLHTAVNGEIVRLRHYFSDVETMRRLGLVA